VAIAEAGKPQAPASAGFERYDPRWRVAGKTGRRGGYLLPVPPGPPELTWEEREAAARAEAKAAARMARFHLVSLSRIGVIAIWLLLAAVVGLVLAELISHHQLY
jgi:hypothetical protein